MNMPRFVLYLLISGMVYLLTSCTETKGAPVELGTVKWGRDLDAALKQSAKSGKPIFLLFQEVPG